jgi:hypothetical protein
VTGKPPYYAMSFGLVIDYVKFNYKNIRYEFACPYIFGDDETHILEGILLNNELFENCRFDGAETQHVEPLPDFTYNNAFIVRVDRNSLNQLKI